MTCLTCGARWNRTTGADDIQMKTELPTAQPQSAPPCPGCGKTMRLQQTTNKTETFFGCSVHKGGARTTYYGIVCALVFGGATLGESGNATDVGSVSSEESFSMWNVPTASRIVSASSCFLMEVDKGCPQPLVFDDSIFGEYVGTLVQNADGAWEPALNTDVSQHRCRVISRSPWWDVSCDEDMWLHEQATMNRAQNLFVDEQFAPSHSQSSHDDSCCYFVDSRPCDCDQCRRTTHEKKDLYRGSPQCACPRV